MAPYLTDRLGGHATNFAIGQQGLAAPFTALRIASAYHRAGRAAEVVLAVLEQTTLPTAFSLVQETPLARLGRGAGPRGRRRGRYGGLRRRPPAVRTGALGGPGGGRAGDDLGEDDTLLVLGPWVSEDVTEDVPAHTAGRPGGPGQLLHQPLAGVGRPLAGVAADLPADRAVRHGSALWPQPRSALRRRR